MTTKQVMEEEINILIKMDCRHRIFELETCHIECAPKKNRLRQSMIRVVEAAMGEVEKDILKKENIMMLDVSFKIQSILNSIKE